MPYPMAEEEDLKDCPQIHRARWEFGEVLDALFNSQREDEWLVISFDDSSWWADLRRDQDRVIQNVEQSNRVREAAARLEQAYQEDLS